MGYKFMSLRMHDIGGGMYKLLVRAQSITDAPLALANKGQVKSFVHKTKCNL